MRPVSVTQQIMDLLYLGAPVAIGVSGGKDSSAVAFATCQYLDEIGHTGPRVLIHSDLGRTEWKESLPWCQQLAERLSLELIVVRREKGDMLARWEQRWTDNVRRYENLECVKLILLWSTPDMRFCTSELKVDIICRELTKRFPGQTIVSANGIRREESKQRSCQPVMKPQKKLTSKTRRTTGVDWHPIIDWTKVEVLAYLEQQHFPLHPAYLLWELTRVSCIFCIMSALGDLRNAVRCPANHDIYQRMTDLELRSTFAFQGGQWLADIAPELVAGSIDMAKVRAYEREKLEAAIPKHLLYTKGWPTVIPSQAEAEQLCEIRQRVSDLVGLQAQYLQPRSLIDRYKELRTLKAGKKC